MSTKDLKIVIVGDGGVGKTTFLKRHMTGEFTKKYIATSGMHFNKLNFYTNFGKFTCNVLDTSGQEKFSYYDTPYWDDADAFIVMFDKTSSVSYVNVDKWIKLCRHRHNGENIPIILCGNKVDLENAKTYDISKHINKNTKFYNISAKSNYNYEKPFLQIIRMCMENDAILFTSSETPIVFPKEYSLHSSIVFPKEYSLHSSIAKSIDIHVSSLTQEHSDKVYDLYIKLKKKTDELEKLEKKFTEFKENINKLMS